MPTFIISQFTYSFVRSSTLESKSEGFDGKKLKDKINSIKKDEPLKRILDSYKVQNDERHNLLHQYLDSLKTEVIHVGETKFTISMLEIAWNVWNKLRSYFLSIDLCLEVPDACPGENNNFMYTWSKAEHYLECEIFGTGEIEFFYRNRNNSYVWGEDTTFEQGFSTAILEKLTFFAW
ncbi:MAG: hypothetical protein KME30_30000 [Iphinoe sp. HA4291-MV1]|jgi:hypothetical protein|nr:hypothetical protein [Iphinoe sp. HA4291-MV1]